MHFSIFSILLALATTGVASIIGADQHRPGFTQHEHKHSDGRTYAIYTLGTAAGTPGGGAPPPAVETQDNFLYRPEPGSTHQYCDTRQAFYHNMKGARGEGDAQQEDCAAVAGWLSSNRGYFIVPGSAWDDDNVLGGRTYIPLVYTSKCGLGIQRQDDQPEPMHIGEADMAALVSNVEKVYPGEGTPAKVEGGGYMYCAEPGSQIWDIPITWGVYNIDAWRQDQINLDYD